MNPCFIPATPLLAHQAPIRSLSPSCLTVSTPRMSLGNNHGGSSHGWGGSSSSNRSTRKNGSGSGGFSGGSGHGPTPPRRSSGGGGAADSGGNPFQSIWRAYNVRLAEAPILTKAFTSLVGFFLGDLIAQKFLNNTPGVGIDRARLARMASFGFLIHGPLGHHWYGALDRTIVGTTPIKVAVKVAVDQVLWAPVFTALFFSYLGLAEKKSFGEIKAKIRNDTWTGVTASWKFWPFAHAINFAFIPTAQRLLYINTLQVGYNVFLSFLGNK